MNGLFQILTRNAFTFCVFLIVVTNIFQTANAQNIPARSAGTVEELIEYSKKLYGSDDILVNGRSYLPEHYNVRGNPYFFSDIWLKGRLIVDGRNYDGQKLLYNIEIEKLILETTINENNKILLLLNTERIDVFYLEQHHFVNAANLLPGSKFTGFVELVYDGSFKVVTRHQKSFVSTYTRSTPNGFYSKTQSIHYIFDNGQLEKLPTKKSVYDYFYTHRKEIKNFMRKNNIKYKKSNTDQLNKLFEFCDSVSTN